MPTNHGRFVDFPVEMIGGGWSDEQLRRAHYFDSPTRFTALGTQQRAIERGQSIEVAPTDVLQIDIDGPEAYTRFEEQLEIYQNCETLPALGKIVERDSRTPGHKHITIELPTEYTIEQRVMLQALLGSDLKRELLSLASHYNGHENPIVFYRPQEECNAASQQAEPRDGADRSRVVAVRNADGSFEAVPRDGRVGRAATPNVRDGLDRLRETVARRRQREYTTIVTDEFLLAPTPDVDSTF